VITVRPPKLAQTERDRMQENDADMQVKPSTRWTLRTRTHITGREERDA